MNTATQPLSDDAFLTTFENLTLAEDQFNHCGHLRLTWLYLNRYPKATAIARVCSAIKAYAESKGASMKFHLTMTDALVRIIRARMETASDTENSINRGNEENWQGFLQNNPDLIQNWRSLLDQHFSAELLASQQARLNLVKPDLKPFSD